MKVACYFGGRTNLGGAERRIGRIMNCLAQRGIEVTFVFLLYEPLEAIRDEYRKLVGEELSLKLVGFKKQKDLYRFVKSERFSSILYTGPYRAMLPFLFAGKMAGSQTILLQVSTGPSVRQFKSTIEMLEFELVARCSSRIDCLYPSTTGAIQRRYKKQKVTTTPCPSTDLNLYMPSKKEKKFAFISRWIPGKNVELFVESMILIEELLYTQGYKIMLCGGSRDGVIEKKVNELIGKSKHPELFIRPGYVDSYNVLPEAEVFFSLQSINNYPSQSLLEAIACGCYIIASDEGDTRLLVKDSFGALCSLRAIDIANKAKEYIEKSEMEKREFIRKAREFSVNNSDFIKSVDHYYEIISNSFSKE